MIRYFIHILLYTNYVTAKIVLPGDFNEKTNYSSCLLKVIKQLTIARTPLDITLVNADHDLTISLSKVDGVTYLTREFSWNDYMYNDAYLIRAEDYQELHNGISVTKQDRFWSPRKEFIIIIENCSSIEEVSSLLYAEKIFNSTVIAKRGEEFSVYGFNPSLNSCNTPAVKELELITKCHEYRSEKTFRFQKAKTLRNCRFTLGTRPSKPDQNVGINKFVLSEWLKNYNNTAVMLDIESTWNITGYPYYKIEGIVGFAFRLDNFRPLDFTYPYYVDANKVVIGYAKKLPLFEAMFNQMKTPTNLMTFLLFVIFSIIAKLLSIFGGRKGDWLRVLLIVGGYFVQNITMREKNTRVSGRFFLLLLILFTYINYNIYVAQMSSVMTSPIKDRQVDDIFETHLHYHPIWNPFYIAEMVGSLKKGADMGYLNIYDYETCKHAFDCMKMVKESNKLLYTLISDRYYNINVWKLTDDCAKPPLFKISTPLNNMYECLMFNPGSTVPEPLSKYIHRLTLGGFTEFYYNKKVFTAKLRSKCKILNQAKPYRLEDIKDLCFPPLVMAVLAITCFICEIIFNAAKNWLRK